MSKPFNLQATNITKQTTIDLTGDYSKFLTEYDGFEPPAYDLLSLDVYRKPGALYQGSKAQPRPITLYCYIFDDVTDTRRDIYDVFATGDEVELEYEKGTTHLWINGVVETMVCRQFEEPQRAKEVVEIGMVCFDPFWRGPEKTLSYNVTNGTRSIINNGTDESLWQYSGGAYYDSNEQAAILPEGGIAKTSLNIGQGGFLFSGQRVEMLFTFYVEPDDQSFVGINPYIEVMGNGYTRKIDPTSVVLDKEWQNEYKAIYDIPDLENITGGNVCFQCLVAPQGYYAMIYNAYMSILQYNMALTYNGDVPAGIDYTITALDNAGSITPNFAIGDETIGISIYLSLQTPRDFFSATIDTQEKTITGARNGTPDLMENLIRYWNRKSTWATLKPGENKIGTQLPPYYEHGTSTARIDITYRERFQGV